MTQVTIPTADLREAFKRVSPFTPRWTTLPVLNFLKLATGEEGGASVLLAATDLDTMACVECDAHVQTPGVMLLPKKALAKLLKTTAADELTFRCTPEGSEVYVVSGKTSIKWYSLAQSEWPMSMLDQKATREILIPSVEGDQFSRMMCGSAWAASKEESRPILNGVLLQRDGDGAIRITATNGHRLVHHEVTNWGDGRRKGFDVIVPATMLVKLQKARFFGEGSVINVTKLGSNFLLLEDVTPGQRRGGTWLVVRLIEGPFPNYWQVIPTGFALGSYDPPQAYGQAVFAKADLLGACERLAPWASDQTHRTKWTFEPARPSVTKMSHEVTIAVDVPDTGQACETVPCSSGHAGSDVFPVYQWGLNIEYVIEILKRLPETEPHVHLWGATKERAMLFQASRLPVDSKGLLVQTVLLLMPLRDFD